MGANLSHTVAGSEREPRNDWLMKAGGGLKDFWRDRTQKAASLFYLLLQLGCSVRSHAVRWHGRPFIHNRCVGVHGAADAKGLVQGRDNERHFFDNVFSRSDSLCRSPGTPFTLVTPMWRRRHFVRANISKPNERRRLFWWVFKIPSHLCEACFFLSNRSCEKQTFYYLSEQWRQRRLKIIISIHIYKPPRLPPRATESLQNRSSLLICQLIAPNESGWTDKLALIADAFRFNCVVLFFFFFIIIPATIKDMIFLGGGNNDGVQ